MKNFMVKSAYRSGRLLRMSQTGAPGRLSSSIARLAGQAALLPSCNPNITKVTTPTFEGIWRLDPGYTLRLSPP